MADSRVRQVETAPASVLTSSPPIGDVIPVAAEIIFPSSISTVDAALAATRDVLRKAAQQDTTPHTLAQYGLTKS